MTPPHRSAADIITPRADLSYADPSDGKLRRLAIRSIERMTGQPKLRRLYESYLAERDPDFWSAGVRKLGLILDYDVDRLDQIPAQGPVIVVANHPYGVLDGLMIGHLVQMRRPDFRVVANGLLTRSAEAAPFLFPIDFAETPSAVATNLRSRKESLAWLKSGGALIVFPGGTVSTAPKPFGPAVDPRWRPFTSKLVHGARSPVVPVCFVGQNSRLFQLASHVSLTLRMSLLFHEVANKIGSRQRIEIGDLVPYVAMAELRDRQALADELRRRTYGLHPTPRLANRVCRLRGS
ncbi:MAG: lysophospholipid acyltransferase family protein [Pseudomonadota bacterium]